jgi:ABC-type transport system involved in multi-copper enzyme maturation permease subunit
LEREEAIWRAQYGDVDAVAERSAANVYTSGQFFGLLLVLLLGILLVTNEFYHQTATSTFLTTPRRARVIGAKLAAGIGAAAGTWFVATAISLVGGVIFFSLKGVSNGLDDWSVQRAIIMNLLAFGIWAVLGIGLGALIRNQLGATITASALYLIGTTVVQVAFFLIYQFWIKEEWVLDLQVFAPSVASQVMITPEVVLGIDADGMPVYGPQWWVGALILLGYGVLAGILGNLLLRKRDIS